MFINSNSQCSLINCNSDGLMHFCSTECVQLKCTNKVKYLGVSIDENMKWRSHIFLTSARIRRTMHKFHQLKSVLNINFLRQVYFGLVQSIATYAISVWGGTFKSLLSPLITTINSVIKIILSHPRRYSTEAIYLEFNVFPLIKLYFLNISLYSLSCEVRQIDKEHTMVTRSAQSFAMLRPRALKTVFQHSPNFMATTAFNLLPPDIQMKKTQKNFKVLIKKWLNDTDTDFLWRSLYDDQ